jgi:hypothetical protein
MTDKQSYKIRTEFGSRGVMTIDHEADTTTVHWVSSNTKSVLGDAANGEAMISRFVARQLSGTIDPWLAAIMSLD